MKILSTEAWQKKTLSEAYLREDKYSDFEVGTCFKVVADKMDDHYKHATVYEVIREIRPAIEDAFEPQILFHVFGHDFSKIWRKSKSFLEEGRDNGIYVILSEDEKNALFTRS